MLMKRILILLLSASIFTFAALAEGGMHSQEINERTGELLNIFTATSDEIKNQRSVFILRNYNPVTETVLLVVKPASNATECNNNELLITAANGEIHNIRAREEQPTICTARIPADWVKDGFTVRIPLSRQRHHDATFDTSKLNLKKIAK